MCHQTQWIVAKGNFDGYVVGLDQSDHGTIKHQVVHAFLLWQQSAALCTKFHCEHMNRIPVNKVIMELKITLHSSTKFRNIVLWRVSIKVAKSLLEFFHSILDNGQIKHSPQSSTCYTAHSQKWRVYWRVLFFDKLQWRIQIVCLKVFTLCLEYWPTTKILNTVHQQNWRV